MAISASNQFTTTGFSYDASGNVLADGTNTYAWNAESEIKTATGVNYTYDGDGDRAQKSNGKIYWYGAGSEILDESDASGNFTDEYVYFGGKRIAHRVVSGNAIYYYAEDFLGSSRVMTTATGTVCYDADFYPYGGERDVTNTCPQNYKFTGKERDAETNNDDFGARYYSSQFGRWISPDWSAIPAPVPYANLTNPQTLNLYAMVGDNPETFADLDGHDPGAMIQAGKDSVGGEPENPSLAEQEPQKANPTPRLRRKTRTKSNNRQFPKARRSQREGIEHPQAELLILQSVFRARVLGATGKDRMDQTDVRKQTLTMATITLELVILTPMIGLTVRGKHQDRSRQKNVLVQTFINSQPGFRITKEPF